MNEAMKKVKKVWNIVSAVIVIVAVIFAVLLVGVRLVGLDVRYVMSGSMEPELPTGSLIYIKKVDPHTELAVGDVITYAMSSSDVSTHRITRVVPGEEPLPELDHMPLRFEVKGDANDDPDGTLVLCANILGKPVFHIPYLGYVASYIQTEQGRLMAISVGAILLLLVFLPDLLFDDKESEKKKKKKGEPEETERDAAADDEVTAQDAAPEAAGETEATPTAEAVEAAGADESAESAEAAEHGETDEIAESAEAVTEEAKTDEQTSTEE